MPPGGKTSIPLSAETALRKYLELALAGGRADDAKQMLDFIKSNAPK